MRDVDILHPPALVGPSSNWIYSLGARSHATAAAACQFGYNFLVISCLGSWAGSCITHTTWGSRVEFPIDASPGNASLIQRLEMQRNICQYSQLDFNNRNLSLPMFCSAVVLYCLLLPILLVTCRRCSKHEKYQNLQLVQALSMNRMHCAGITALFHRPCTERSHSNHVLSCANGTAQSRSQKNVRVGSRTAGLQVF